MPRPNLIVSALLASESVDATSFVDTTALDNFSPDFAAQIDALGTVGNPTSLALDADPTSIKATEIKWGDATNGAVLTGTGLSQISNIAQLEADLAAGIASGAFDTLRIIAGGQDILTLEFAASALTLRSGDQTLALRGDLPTSFQGVFDFVEQIGNVLDAADGVVGIDLATAANLLEDYDLEGLRLTDGSETLFDATLSNTGVSVSVAEVELRIDGRIPADNLGDIVRLLDQIDDLEQTVAGFNALSQIPDLSISGITLTAADGTPLIRTSGPLDEIDPPFETLIIEGTPGDDRDVYGDGFGGLSRQVVVNLGAGNDSAEIFGEFFIYDDDDTPVTFNGGTGIDTMRVLDYTSQQVVVDFFARSVSGREAEDQINYDVKMNNFEAVEVSSFQRAVVFGDAADNQAGLAEVFGRFEFYGGAGTDTLDLTQVLRDSTDERGLSRDDLGDFSAVYGGGNSIELTHADLSATIVLGDVERVRLKDGAGVTFASFNELLAESGGITSFIVGTSGSDSLKGDLGADVLLGQSGADYLYGDGIQANLTGDVAGQVYRMYRATLDRDPDTTGYKGWVAQLYEGRVALADFPNGFVNSGEFKNTYGALDDSAFVNLLYRNVLERDADAGGLQGWLDAMAAGTTRAGVVLGFSQSAEFRKDTADASAQFALSQSETHWTDDIYRMYRATLDRDPDAQGFSGWAEALGSGTSFATMIGGFTNSREFKNTYGALDDTGFIQLLYRNVLEREADRDGLEGWLESIAVGGTREAVVEGFAQSAEFRRDTTADLTAWVKAQGRQDVQDVQGPQDKLIGGPGTEMDTMMGGLMSDVFVFEGNQPARATIVDFEAWDVLQLTGYTDVTNFVQFRDALSEDGANTVFASQGTEITFLNTAITDFVGDQVEYFAGF